MERLLIIVSLIAGIYSEGDNDLVDLGVGLDIDLNLGLGGGCVSVRGCNLDLNLPEVSSTTGRTLKTLNIKIQFA